MRCKRERPARRQQIARDRDRLVLEVTAADRAVDTFRSHDHPRAGRRGTEPFAEATLTRTAGRRAATCDDSFATQFFMAAATGAPARTALIAFRIDSPVAGASSGGFTRCPPTLEMASRIAKEHGKRQQQRRLARRFRAMDRVLDVAVPIELRAEVAGQSLTDGILYVDGACVINAPSLFHQSSLGREPAHPWMNAPSTWPMSIAGLMESPASCSKSARSSLNSPVSVSTITSETAAP
jgi:hypothetical protein